MQQSPGHAGPRKGMHGPGAYPHAPETFPAALESAVPGAGVRGDLIQYRRQGRALPVRWMRAMYR